MRVSEKRLRDVAKVLDDTDIYIDRTAIPREVRVYEGRNLTRFESNRAAYDYLIDRLQAELKDY